MNEREQGDMLGVVFDALPSIVFIVDDDVKIQEFNAAASALMAVERATVLKQRAGEILHCIHSRDVKEGCGRGPFCKNCIIRNSVTEAFVGNRVVRRRTRIELFRDMNKIEIYALISASPFSFQGRSLVLLVIEDISEIAELYQMILICSVCRKVRDDKESWMMVENYFLTKWGVEFSHGLCPACAEIEEEKIKLFIKAEQANQPDAE